MKKTFFILILSLIVIVFGISYAFFSYVDVSEKNEVITGQIYLGYKETKEISLTNMLPETKEEALLREEGGIFEFTISGQNTSEYDIYYEIDLLNGNPVNGKTTIIKPEHVMIYLECDGQVLIDGVSYNDWDKKAIWVDTIDGGTLDSIEKKYELRMWFSDDIIISDTNPNADYTTEEWNTGYASLKVLVWGDFSEKGAKIPLQNKIQNNMNLTTEDVDGTRYVYGGNVINNYVWYSGKLWRIVCINGDGTIKLVTENNIVALAWNTSASNTNYTKSLAYKWLNGEFLKTLVNTDSLLVSSSWDYTTYTSFPTEKLQPVDIASNEIVGMLSIYDFMMTGGSDNTSDGNTFLNNGKNWWTISPETASSKVWRVFHTGEAYYVSPDYGYGIRPAINLKQGILISGGTGERSDPYIIDGDKLTGTKNELLSNRISGEYINFDNNVYRIVGIEEINGQSLTKVTMVNNYLSSTQSFGDDSSDTAYNTSTGIGKYLNDWYDGASIDNVYKEMIATKDDGIIWYIGPVNGVNRDYRLSKTGTTVSATIGLPYYGEMFSGVFGTVQDSLPSRWLITRFLSTKVWYISNQVQMNGGIPTEENGVYPSFYLKANVIITDIDNDGELGTGKPNDPYEISQLLNEEAN